jgi:crotonobetainyl-CoA:carnitine CoA-transferase CaiB-like acyl-CoA transferase
MLAEMGAQVIRQESRNHIEFYRYIFSPDKTDAESGPLFHVFNRGQLSVSLDLKKPEAIELAKRIIKISDVFFGNNAGGILGNKEGKLGLCYDIVKQVNPQIIMVDMSGYGDYGPMKSAPAYGSPMAAQCGFSELFGYYGERPVGETQYYADPVAGTHALIAILAALHYREKTGEGQYIDISELETLTSMMGKEFIDYFMNGRIATCTGNRNDFIAPHGCYPSKGEDKWITIACANEEEWQALCKVTGNVNWINDKRFANMYLRLTNAKELDKLISAWTCLRTNYEAMEILQKAGIAAVPVLSIAEMFTDPHFREEKYFVPLPHPYDPSSWVFNVAWKLSQTPGGLTTPAPLLGEHSEYVLCDLCELSREEFNRLVKNQIIY